MAARWDLPGMGDLMARAYDLREGRLDPAAVKARISDLKSYLDALVDVAGGIRPDETIADAGCGAGSTSLGLAARGSRVRVGGVDISPKAVEAATAAAAALKVPARFKQAHAGDLPSFAPGASLVLAAFVFDLVPEKGAFLRALASTVSKGGRVVLVDAFVEPTLAGTEAALGSAGPVMPATFTAMATASGLSVVSQRDITDLVTELNQRGVWPWVEHVRLGLRIVAWRLERPRGAQS